MINSVSANVTPVEVPNQEETQNRQYVTMRGNDYERTPDSDTYESSSNKTAKAVGIGAALLAIGATIYAGCHGKNILEKAGKETGFMENIKTGYKNFFKKAENAVKDAEKKVDETVEEAATGTETKAKETAEEAATGTETKTENAAVNAGKGTENKTENAAENAVTGAENETENAAENVVKDAETKTENAAGEQDGYGGWLNGKSKEELQGKSDNQLFLEFLHERFGNKI